uniref:Uncharacterized protein n=1 Tax=viral metagenome TaxID=1070528 RepID=A0A6M3L9R0_9ZZZZ
MKKYISIILLMGLLLVSSQVYSGTIKVDEVHTGDFYSDTNDYINFNDVIWSLETIIFKDQTSAITLGDGTQGVDWRLLADGNANDGWIKYKEDEDRWDFNNDVDVIGDLTAGTITSDAGISGTSVSTDLLTLTGGTITEAAQINVTKIDTYLPGVTVGVTLDDDLYVTGMITAHKKEVGIDAEATDAYVVDLDPNLSAYSEGLVVWFDPNNANTGACTLRLTGGLTAKSIKTQGGDDPPDNYIEATYSRPGVMYNATQGCWILITPDANP